MKVPKRLVRNADGTKTLERPYRLVIIDGQAVRAYNDDKSFHDERGAWRLPAGARWATEADAHHDEVAEGVAHRAAYAKR